MFALACTHTLRLTSCFFFPRLVSLIWLIIDLSLLSSIWVIVLVAARLCGSGFVFLVVDRAEWTVSAQVDACLEPCTITNNNGANVAI